MYWDAIPSSALWSLNTNWSTTSGADTPDPTAAPGATTGSANADTATFNANSSYLNVTTDSNRNIKSITFDTTSAGAYVIGSTGGNTLLLTTAGAITYNAVNNANNMTVNAPLQIQGSVGTYIFTANQTGSGMLLIGGGITGVETAAKTTTLTLNGTSTGNNQINGVIGNGSGGGSVALTKSSAGSWILSGANTYSGATTVSGGTLKLANHSAVQNSTLTMNGGACGLVFDSSAGVNTSTFGGLAASSTGAGYDIVLQNNAETPAAIALTVGGNNVSTTYAGALSGTGGSLTKAGDGTLTLNGSAVNTFTGGLSIYAGTLELDFTKLDTPTDLINSGNALTLGSGTLSIKGKTGAFSTSQTFRSLTVNSYAQILLNPKGGTGTTISLSSIVTVNAVGRSLLVGKASGAGSGDAIITTTDNKDGQGIYGVHVLYTDGTTSNYNWATTASVISPYTFGAYGTAYGSYANLATTSGTDTNNSRITAGATLGASRTTNSLKIEGGGLTLALGANTLTLTSGGLLSTGAVASTISGAAGATGLMGGNNGSGSYDLIVHQYNTGGLTISAVIGDNGAKPTALTKSGADTCTLTLFGANTYTGDTIVNKGTLSISHAYLNDAAAVKIDLGARMDLSFTGSDQIAELWLGGAQMVPGTYDGSTSTPIDYRSYFTGDGSLHVVLVRLPGDANLDGVVDATDYITLKQNFGMTGADWSHGNFTVDTVGDGGTVDWADLQLLMTNFGTRGAAPAAPTAPAPEPGSVMLLMFGAAALLRRSQGFLAGG